MCKRIITLIVTLSLLFPLMAENQPEAVTGATVAAADPTESYEEQPLEDDTYMENAQFVPVARMTTAQHFAELGMRFGINLLASLLIVGLLYYRRSRRRDYFFTFMVFSSAMLLLLYIMGNVSLGVGLTLGLFAIFGVIRYRTETVPIREMTYLFVIIAVAAMNGLAPLYNEAGAAGMDPHFELDGGILSVVAMANLLMIGLVALLDCGPLSARTTARLILYDRIELIVPERRDELVADLEKRLGVKVEEVEIGHVDFLKDAAFIKVSYPLGKGETDSISTLTQASKFTN
ncbi:MAG: DUF4956 domain-containing protein [Bacteroidales bacterium]|nr:DUF4956 domain-containing protein [Bacteroidales bacterium]